MSYAAKAAVYDNFRAAAPGWGRMAKRLNSLKGLRVLDLGCGSGAFLGRILSLQPAGVVAMDPCAEMAAIAREKGRTQAALARVETPDVVVGDVRDLDADAFDVVVCAQVLQNLTNAPDEARAARHAFLSEIRRTLKPGGMALLTTRWVPQAGYGSMYWYTDEGLVPEALSKMQRFVPEAPDEEMRDAGFVGARNENSRDLLYSGDSYLDALRVKDDAWRAADSFFGHLSGAELDALCARVDGLAAEGRLEEYVRRRDALRGNDGHIAVVTAYKD